ncbi:MAG: TolC family protein [Flavobacteriaceae bacterium]|nr:TolC family protein [Flavobacteriaceae bacterium]
MKKILILVLAGFYFAPLQAQQSSYSLSLEQAIALAQDSSYASLNARREMTRALKKKWETTATGLPQINGSISYNNNIKQPVTLIPGEITGGAPGSFTPVIFGTEQNATAQATLEQLIFDGSYLVGLQAAKTFLDFSKNAYEKTQIEVEKSVVNAYGSAKMAEALVSVFDNNYKTLKKSYDELQIVYENGLTELEALEQLEITLLEVKGYLDNAQRSQRLAQHLLRATLGLPLTTELILTDELDTLILRAGEEINPDITLDLQKQIDVRIAENFTEQRRLEWQLERSSALPSLSAFANYSTQAFSNDFTFTDNTQQWFQSSVLGIRMQVPIFSSGFRSARSSQAKIAWDQAKTEFAQTKQATQIAFENALSDFNLSKDNFDNASKSLNLAERVASKNQIKFDQGIASSFDLYQAQAQFYRAQQNYYTSLLALLNAKTVLETFINPPTF